MAHVTPAQPGAGPAGALPPPIRRTVPSPRHQDTARREGIEWGSELLRKRFVSALAASDARGGHEGENR